MKEKRSKIVYISSPYAGDIPANVDFAKRACLYAICLGYTPIAPHLFYPSIIPDDDPAWRQVGLSMCCELLVMCDELWACGPCTTAGMKSEVNKAKELGLWIRHVTCEEVTNGLEAMEAMAIEARQKALQP